MKSQQTREVFYPLATGGAVNGSPSANAADAKARSTISKALKITLTGIDPTAAEIV